MIQTLFGTVEQEPTLLERLKSGVQKTRAGLVRIAIREARRRGWFARGAPISLIGDAPADILAARANGIRAIAVATGLTAADELESHQPDILLKNLRDLRLRMVEA